MLARDPRRAVPVALGEPGPVDQPGGGELHVPRLVRVARDLGLGPQTLGGTLTEGRVLLRRQHRVGEERTGAPGVGVRRVQDHALAPTQPQDDLARLLQRHPLPRVHTHGAGDLGVTDRAARRSTTQLEDHLANHVTVAPLEDAVPVGETAVGVGHGDPLARDTVQDQHLTDGLGDVLTVGPDVLDRRGADPTGDTGEELDAVEPLGDGPLHQRIPLHTRVRPQQDDPLSGLRVGPGLGEGHALGRDQDHGPGEAVVGDHQVAAATEHEHTLSGAVGLGDQSDQFVRGGGGVEGLGGASQSERGVVGEHRGHGLTSTCERSGHGRGERVRPAARRRRPWPGPWRPRSGRSAGR